MNWILTALALLLPLQGHATSQFNFPEGTVELLGSSDRVGVLFELKPDWHIYWKNPGDSGASPKWKWTRPQGTVLDPRWPLPQRIEVQGLHNIGFERRVFFSFPLQDSLSGPQSVKLDLEFLVCKVECIPYQTKLETQWSSSQPSSKFIAAESETLKSLPIDPVTGRWNKGAGVLTFEIRKEKLGQVSGTQWDLFPEDGNQFLANPPQIEVAQDRLIVSISTNGNLQTITPSSKFLLTATQGRTPVQGWSFVVETSQDGSGTAGLGTTLDQGAASQPFGLLLLWAFLGGVILNLMPCVFPVLGLKILSFWGPQKDAKRLLKHSWSYAVGVVASFVALGGLLLFLRSLGEQIGWGFQLQSPLVVILLAMLFFWLGLNLLGFFEITWTPSLGGKNKKDSLYSSFLTGVLATVVATPCTAPFMGAALGAALTLPAGLTLMIFSFLGLGMAAPFLLLGYFPQGLRLLPRPGNWMLRLKEFLAFPLFITSVWLLWVLGQQVPIEVLCLVLLLMVLVGFLIWIHAVSQRAPLKSGALILGIVLSAALPFTFAVDQKAPPPAQSRVWQDFSEEKVTEARSQGKPVFIDFTAAWCITCQVNKRLVLNTEEVLHEFERQGVVLFRADWTDRNPLITAALEKLGRNSLPVYAYYAPRSEKALLLPEVLTREIVFETLKGGK